MSDRLAFVDYFPTHYRLRLYEELARRADVDFYFFADQRERYWNRKIPLVQEGGFRRIELRRYRLGDEAFMPGVWGRLARGRYAAVIKSLNGKIMMPATYAAARAGKAGFVLWTGMWYHPQNKVHRISRPLTEQVYRGADAIVTYGDHVKRYVLETPGVDAEKVYVAGQAVDSARFTAVEPKRNGAVPEILYVGQFEERKGLDYLLDAFESLEAPARLRLVGNGTQEDWLRDRIGGRDDVEIVGYVPQDELPGQLAKARCLVLPSITTTIDKEPWGLVCNEAMHAGLPVVATDAVGAAVGGLIRDGESGLVVPERDSSALAGAMGRLVSDPAYAARMGDAARADAAAFNYDRMASAFLAAAEHAIAARRNR